MVLERAEPEDRLRQSQKALGRDSPTSVSGLKWAGGQDRVETPDARASVAAARVQAVADALLLIVNFGEGRLQLRTPFAVAG